MREAGFLLGVMRPYRRLLAGGGILMLAESAAALVVPWIGGLAVGAIVDRDTARLGLGTALVALLLAFAALALLRFGASYLLDTAADRVGANLKATLYDHLQALPVGYFNERRLGDSLALLTNDVYVVGAFVSGTAVALVPLAITGAGAAAMMFTIRPDLALIAVVLIPLAFLALKVAGRRMRPLSVQRQEEEAASIALAQENLALLPVVKVFGREEGESARYRAQVGRVLDIAGRQRRWQMALGPLAQFAAGAAVVGLVALASADLIAGHLAAAELVAFLLYAQLLTRPVSGLADVYGQVQMARGALTRLDRVMAESPEPARHDGARLPPLEGHIEWRGVEFSYPGRERALDGLDLRIQAGEWVAIVGPNGAGKSTLAHLLLRLHSPSAGSIAADGIDLANVSLASLRDQVGVVPQNVMLFNASVRDNIAYGRPGADAAAIERAARMARAHDFISRLPQGYDTPIGDGGVRLSGGERQRVALARALLKEPRILVLDEATAMFDPQAEDEFLAACRDAMDGRTVLMITHRPASLGLADRIVHLRDGRVERIEERPARALRLVGQG